MLNETKADQLRELWLYLEKADDSIHQVLKPKGTFSLFKFEFPFFFQFVFFPSPNNYKFLLRYIFLLSLSISTLYLANGFLEVEMKCGT